MSKQTEIFCLGNWVYNSQNLVALEFEAYEPEEMALTSPSFQWGNQGDSSGQHLAWSPKGCELQDWTSCMLHEGITLYRVPGTSQDRVSVLKREQMMPTIVAVILPLPLAQRLENKEERAHFPQMVRDTFKRHK